MLDLWFTEFQSANYGITTRVKETLFVGKSDFQEVVVVDTQEFGRELIIDGIAQTSLFDEYVYHEMMAHVLMCTHPNPKNVLVIGGGDGGVIREVLKHPKVERAEMVEIDAMVVEVCKKFLPEIAVEMVNCNPKFHLKIGNGITHIAEAENEYDVVIIDCSDPVGPSEGLFSVNFYKDLYKALKPDGIFVQQTESPFYYETLIKDVRDAAVAASFPITRLYLANIPLYYGGTFSYTVGSKKYDPMTADLSNIPELHTRYYTKDIHKSSFVLPRFVEDYLK
jgi:spermidine synthase